MEKTDAVAALAALAQDNRIDVFRLLVQAGSDGLAAGAVAERRSLAPNTLSFHFDRLRNAGLVTCRRVGAFVAHVMFELPVFQVASAVREGAGQWVAEAVATFGLLLTIFGCLSGARVAIPYAVGLYITAAYWFTASTSFANPAVTLARSPSDTFAGIAPGSVPAFIAAQCTGALAAMLLAAWLWPARRAA